ncbi:MAG: transcription-repair coupling factor [Solirubrobacteraceae bacterium]|nr:transcription-repair coupling factor [Solirubrobacteraceae bacterium]
MPLRALLGALANDPEGAKLLRDGGDAFVSRSLRPYAIAALLDNDAAKSAVVVAGDDNEAQALAADLGIWLAPRPVRFYPSRGVTYESHLAPPPHLVGLRVAALDALLDPAEGEPPVVVVSAVALSEKVPDPALRPRGFTLRKGDLIDLDEAALQLVAAGYERVSEVSERGQFAIRGGILDCFPATEDHAVRVDCFDIEIESLRHFSTFTQRSLGEIELVEIAPAAELAAEHRELAEIAALSDADERPDITDLLPLDRFQALLELVPPDALVIVGAAEEIAPALGDHWQDVCAAFHDADAHHLYVAPDAVQAALAERSKARISSLLADQPIELHAQAADFSAQSLAEAEPELESLVRSGYKTVVAFSRRGEGERVAHNLARLSADWIDETEPFADSDGRLLFSLAALRSGFVAAGAKLAVIPERRLFRRRRAARSDDQPERLGRFASLFELRTGDTVVHEDHGVARFSGFETKTVSEITRDYLELEYADGDRVFMPVDQLAKITRYIGAGELSPKLSKLGGKGWETLKARARKAAEGLAGELLNLYAERRRREGRAFSEDSEWQLDFESRFPWQETADQASAIEAVKQDMERPRPMDRLICGDVGYGKTEVALRAAFKAAGDGAQVLVLAPTTILAQQHYGTFSERLEDFPFTVDVVSRLRSAAEQRASVANFNEGKTDILIGTHRLLGRDMRPNDLGLLVVDEEQRFGVKQKELLRQMKLKVDVIAMSATPIPRTLQMSLAGMRDISVIETPPEGRRPVKTFVGEYDEELVRLALEREHERGGQSFFLHNRVETIDETAERLRGLCPKLTFDVAHGQLDEHELEERMMRFLRGDSDVLVSTSIIESGIDIPQANTLIVERADRFGLSQLYQIRGRVGRSRERAYAYLLYPSAAALTEEATRRLSALSDYTELGAGFKIAMRDLEIRGAGNLLGDEQSGHVAALGFELYLSMLDEAVRAAGPPSAGDDDYEPVRFDVDVDAYIPTDYIPYEQAKIDVHRRIAASREIADLALLGEELADRFGPLPQELENLIALQQARVRLGQAGAGVVTIRGERMTVTPLDFGDQQQQALSSELPEAKYEPGRAQLSIPLPADGAERLMMIASVATVLLAVSRQTA